MPHFDSCGHRKAVRSDVCTASDAMRAIYTVLLCNFISGGCADVGKLCASHLVNRGRIMTPVSDENAMNLELDTFSAFFEANNDNAPPGKREVEKAQSAHALRCRQRAIG